MVVEVNILCNSCGASLSAVLAFNGLTMCKLCSWYIKYADDIDYQIATGKRVNKAIEIVRVKIRPRCTTCGGLIKHGAPDVLFCSKPMCKRSARRLRYYRSHYGLPHDDALNLVVSMYKGR